MTQAERQAVIYSACAAIRRLVPTRYREELNHHLEAMAAALNEEARLGYQAGKIDGMIAIEARADHRDICEPKDPAELRMLH